MKKINKYTELNFWNDKMVTVLSEQIAAVTERSSAMTFSFADIDAIHAAIHEGDEPEAVECCDNCQVADCGFSNGPDDYCHEHIKHVEPEPEPEEDCCGNRRFIMEHYNDQVNCHFNLHEEIKPQVSKCWTGCGEHRRKE